MVGYEKSPQRTLSLEQNAFLPVSQDTVSSALLDMPRLCLRRAINSRSTSGSSIVSLFLLDLTAEYAFSDSNQPYAGTKELDPIDVLCDCWKRANGRSWTYSESEKCQERPLRCMNHQGAQHQQFLHHSPTCLVRWNSIYFRRNFSFFFLLYSSNAASE